MNVGFFLEEEDRMKGKWYQRWQLGVLFTSMLLILGVASGCSSNAKETTQSTTTSSVNKQLQSQAEKQAADAKKAEEAKKQAADAKKAEEAQKLQDQIRQARQETMKELVAKEYEGTQTIEINHNVPLFTTEDLSLKKGAWESYGDLDALNRATLAEAMLNKSLMPTGERGDISSISPTGWKNKQIKGGYLYNRSHLIGWALSGENANWKNLITGTRQLNSPEMLRFEMDVKTYLEQNPQNYVRYRVTPIFRENELLARGVEMEAQSISSDAITFHVYIFNVQQGVTLNYADGSSVVSNEFLSDEERTANEKAVQAQQAQAATQTNTVANEDKEYVNPTTGQGLIKGSKNKIYHVPGSKYYEQTTNPEAYFKTIREAEQAGYRAPKR